MKIKINEGGLDRVIRSMIGGALVVGGIMYSPWLFIPAAILLVTAVTGFCPLYTLLRINTCKL